MYELDKGEIVARDRAIANQGQPQAESGEALLLTRFLLGLLLAIGCITTPDPVAKSSEAVYVGLRTTFNNYLESYLNYRDLMP